MSYITYRVRYVGLAAETAAVDDRAAAGLYEHIRVRYAHILNMSYPHYTYDVMDDEYEYEYE
eukprot:scaffold376002_cov22-Prasinocladus_malaysianus.AAC.1